MDFGKWTVSGGSGSTQTRLVYNFPITASGSNRNPGQTTPESWPEGSLGPCTNECDSDTDCAVGLVCYEKDNGVTPGCVGNGKGDGRWDYCYSPDWDSKPIEVPPPATPQCGWQTDAADKALVQCCFGQTTENDFIATICERDGTSISNASINLIPYVCALEGSSCLCDGLIVYGADYTKTANMEKIAEHGAGDSKAYESDGSIAVNCDNGVFGDVAPNVYKHCTCYPRGIAVYEVPVTYSHAEAVCAAKGDGWEICNEKSTSCPHNVCERDTGYIGEFGSFGSWQYGLRPTSVVAAERSIKENRENSCFWVLDEGIGLIRKPVYVGTGVPEISESTGYEQCDTLARINVGSSKMDTIDEYGQHWLADNDASQPIPITCNAARESPNFEGFCGKPEMGYTKQWGSVRCKNSAPVDPPLCCAPTTCGPGSNYFVSQRIESQSSTELQEIALNLNRSYEERLLCGLTTYCRTLVDENKFPNECWDPAVNDSPTYPDIPFDCGLRSVLAPTYGYFRSGNMPRCDDGHLEAAAFASRFGESNNYLLSNGKARQRAFADVLATLVYQHHCLRLQNIDEEQTSSWTD